jgi:phosphohistidine swiveling domain-containing protein
MKHIDWRFYLERRNSIFYQSIFITAYGPLLRKRLGFGFRKQLQLAHNGVFTFYRSGKELDAADRFFLKLAQDRKKVLLLHRKCLRIERKEQKLVASFTKISAPNIKKNYAGIIKELEEIFMYMTVVPWLILHAADKYAVNQEIIERFMDLRRTSRVALQPLVLEKIWKAAGTNHMQYFYYTSDELQRYMLTGKRPANVKRRKKSCAFYLDRGKIVFNYNANFAEKQGIKEQIHQSVNVVHGKSAYLGKARGRVCLLFRPTDLPKFRRGNIIVSVNTTPSLMPALEKCSAIVTDEGGLICHAAIISRELKKPCLIGTKIATKVFKDGDIIEVDAGRGIARKINK